MSLFSNMFLFLNIDVQGETSASKEKTTDERTSSQSEEEKEDEEEESVKETSQEEKSQEDKTKKKQKQKQKEPTKEFPQDEVVKSNILKLRGIPFKCTEQDVIEFFRPLSIDDIRFPKNKKGRPSGYAFVDFASRKEAQEAMKKNGKKLKGRYIELFTEINDKPSDNNKLYGKNGEWLNKVGLPFFYLLSVKRIYNFLLLL